MSGHIAELTRDLDAARQLHASTATWSAESVGTFIRAVLQGSFVFAKAKQSPDVVRECIEHLRRFYAFYFRRLLTRPQRRNTNPSKAIMLTDADPEAHEKSASTSGGQSGRTVGGSRRITLP